MRLPCPLSLCSWGLVPVLHQAALRLSTCAPSIDLTLARTSGIRWAALICRQRRSAMARSLNAISRPFWREPAPWVTRWPSRSVVNGDSITFPQP